MQAFSKYNKGIKYLLTVIDIFSKYGWLMPLKNKKGLEVTSALEKIFKERKPEKLWVDRGKEFYNSHVQKLVALYSTENEEKSSVVERWNQTVAGHRGPFGNSVIRDRRRGVRSRRSHYMGESSTL